MANGNILYNFSFDVPKLFIVVSDQAFSILLMIFFPVDLLEDVIVED